MKRPGNRFLLARASRESKSTMPRVMPALSESGVVVDVIHPSARVIQGPAPKLALVAVREGFTRCPASS